jgi:hypothetical protein
MDLFGGLVTEFVEGQRVATWRGVHVSQYSAGCTALLEMLPLVATPVLQNVLILSASAALQRLLPLLTSAALQKFLLLVTSSVLPKMLASELASQWLLVPAGIYAVYSALKLYDGKVVESEVDRRRIR